MAVVLALAAAVPAPLLADSVVATEAQETQRIRAGEVLLISSRLNHSFLYQLFENEEVAGLASGGLVSRLHFINGGAKFRTLADALAAKQSPIELVLIEDLEVLGHLPPQEQNVLKELYMAGTALGTVAPTGASLRESLGLGGHAADLPEDEENVVAAQRDPGTGVVHDFIYHLDGPHHYHFSKSFGIALEELLAWVK